MIENLEDEVWMTHPIYTDFAASNYGRIKHLANDKSRKEKLRKLKPDKDGYLRFRICNKKLGIDEKHLVHRFCYEAFHQCLIPKDERNLQINHKNENKTDNRVFENLELVTPKQNSNWGTRNKRLSEVLTNRSDQSKQIKQYTLDGELVKVWKSIREAGRNGFIRQAIISCCKGRVKTHKGFIWQYIDE